MKRAFIIVGALAFLAGCGSNGFVKNTTPVTKPATTEAGKAPTTITPTTNTTSTTEAPTTTAEAPTTAAKPECSEGVTEHRNETPDGGFDVYTCRSGKFEFVRNVAATTTTAPEEGTRAHPYAVGSVLTSDSYSSIVFGPVELVNPADVHKANQFNDALPAGQAYVRVHVEATYSGADKGTPYDFTRIGLAGDNGKIYTSAFISDSHNVLDLITDQPDVLSGGTMSGNVYYVVDIGDANFLMVEQGANRTVFVDVSP
jgi:hypothetical protein